MRIIEQWSIVSQHTHGYRDAYEAKIEPQGVVVSGLIFGHELRGTGQHQFDDGRRWLTGQLLSMPDPIVAHCDDGDYMLGEPDKGYMRSFSGMIQTILFDQFRADGESFFDEQDPVESDPPTEEELAQDERDYFDQEQNETDDNWSLFCDQSREGKEMD